MINLPDQPDIDALRRGDPDATRRLWHAVYPGALRLAWHYTGDRDEAEDIVQEAFLKALRKLPLFAEDSHFAAWFQRILVNSCHDWRKSAVRRLRTVLSPWQWDKLPAEGTNQHFSQLGNLIRRLPRKLRMVFILRELEELSPAEIAGILDLAESTVRVMSMQARRQLRIWLEETWENPR